MADGPPHENDVGGMQSIEEWIRNIADSEDISEEEVLDRMMTSYWIFNELTSFVDDNRDSGSISAAETDPSSRTTDSTTTEGTPPSDDELEQFLALAETLQGSSAAGATEQGGHYDESLNRIDDELSRLHEDIDRLTTRIDNIVSSGVGTGQSTPTHQEVPSDVLTDDDLDPLADEIDDLKEQVSELEDQQTSEQERVNTNFSHIEDVLEYLVGRVNSFDDQIESLSDQLTLAQAQDQDDDTLQHIRTTANANGVKEAYCGNCGESVSISLLDEAVCPHCNASFEGLESNTKWFGLAQSHELSVSNQGPHTNQSRNAATQATDQPKSPNSTQQDESGVPSSVQDAESLEDLTTDDISDDEFIWSE